MASAGDGTGWTSGGTAIGTGSARRSAYSHPHIWHWRDWIVESLNADKGYDRMVEEMLAGDELAPDDPATPPRHGIPGAQLGHLQPQRLAGEHGRAHVPGLPRRDHPTAPGATTTSTTPSPRPTTTDLRAFFEPYQIRIDRVPGQLDRTKAGLPRVFDDFMKTPTFLFVRGDEASPDTSRPMTPAIPAVLGGEIKIEPVSLPDHRRLPGQAGIRHS